MLGFLVSELHAQIPTRVGKNQQRLKINRRKKQKKIIFLITYYTQQTKANDSR